VTQAWDTERLVAWLLDGDVGLQYQARQAHELLGSGSVAGKLVLILDLEA
jgi:hypothetical protein